MQTAALQKIIDDRRKHAEFVSGTDPIGYSWTSRHFQAGAEAALRHARDALPPGDDRDFLDGLVTRLIKHGSPNHPNVTVEDVLRHRRERPKPAAETTEPTTAA